MALVWAAVGVEIPTGFFAFTEEGGVEDFEGGGLFEIVSVLHFPLPVSPYLCPE